MVIIDAYDTCRGWCPFFYSNDIQRIIKPFLRSTLSYSNCSSSSSLSSLSSLSLPLVSNKINIVWHVRSMSITGDVCNHCNDSDYYTSIYNSILPAFTTTTTATSTTTKYLDHQNIVVHMKSFSQKVPSLFKDIPSVRLYDRYYYYQ